MQRSSVAFPIHAALALALSLLAGATRGDDARFDYHSVRGRQPIASESSRYEGETDFEMRGKSRVQSMGHYGPHWSGNAHLLWDGKVGESMESAIEIDHDGVYDIAIQLTTAVDYGEFELTMSGTNGQRTVNLFDPRVALAPLIKLRDVKLDKGRQPIRFELIGAAPGAKRFRGVGYLMGLDYLQLTRKDAPKEQQDKDPLGPNVAPVVAAEPMPIAELVASHQQFCFECHRRDQAESEIDLGKLETLESLLDNIETTRRIRDAVANHEMPPKEEPQPGPETRQRMVSTFDRVIARYLEEHASSAPVVMRRMNRYEYNNAVRDLLKLRGDIYPLPEKTIRADRPYFEPARGKFPSAVMVGNRTLGKNQVERQILTGVSPFAIDLQAEGGFNNRGSELSVSPILLESFLQLGRSIVTSPEFDDYCGVSVSLFGEPENQTPDQQKETARARLSGLLSVAFRSQPEEPVTDRYHGFFVRRFDATGSFSASMKDVVAAILASPRFIYLSQQGPSDGVHPLDPFELATRLSFFLWSSIPDDELLTAARDGSLSEPAVLDAQVIRMLEDPRSQALSQNFARQWLRLDQLVTAVPDFQRFHRYYSRIGCEQWKFGLQTMLEPLLLFESIMVEDRSIMLLVDCNFSYRSDELESWYKDEVPFANRENRNRFNTNQQSFRRRELTTRREGGVITSAATLTMTSAPLRTSPISRGAWVATVIFNRPPPPPPDVVPPIEADDKVIEAKGLTLRQRLQEHQSNASCVACHSKIDPLGFALENYDAVGRWRDRYASGLEIDASGEVFGRLKFNDAVELKEQLLEHPEFFMRAFSEHLLSYALGRELELEDSTAIDEIVTRVAADHGQFTTVVRQIVQSHPFRYRSSQAAGVSP